jgi:hypothetical protein
MIFFDQEMLRTYAEIDPLLSMMGSAASDNDDTFTSHRWLKESMPKRLIFFHMYGDLLGAKEPGKKVLDVGGGFTGLTRKMLENHDYQLLDIMAHDRHGSLRAIEGATARSFWVNSDWYDWEPKGEYDLVIANDLFPNVDQRLEEFLEKYLLLCREMRISLTYYNKRRWYRVKRMDGDEIFHMMAWSGSDVRRVLQKYVHRISNPRLELLEEERPSLFPNGRLVCLVGFCGGKGC